MPSSYTSNLGMELQATGENDGTWGGKANAVFNQIDEAIAGVAAVTITATGLTLAITDAGTGEAARHFQIDVNGTPTAVPTMIVPNIEKAWIIRNNSGKDVLMRTATGSTATVGAGINTFMYCDGSNVIARALPNDRLDEIEALAVTDSNLIVGNGSSWVAESGATLRTSLGLGTGDTPDFTGITFGGAGGTLNRWVTGGWSPTLTVGGGADKITSSTAIYARIGTLVFVHAYIVANRGTDTGTIAIGGLPFTVSSAAGSAGPISFVAYDNSDGYNGGLLAAFKFGENSTNINTYSQGNSGSWALQALNGSTFMRASYNVSMTLSGCFITSSA
jgi:hypothetical protein